MSVHSRILVPFIIILSLLLFSTSACLQTSVPVIEADIMVEFVDERPVITSINLSSSEMNVLLAPKGTDVGFPSVNGQTITNFEKVGYWAAVPYEGAGEYHLTLGFRREALPEELDHIKVVITVNDEMGKPIAKSQNMLIWGFEDQP